MPSNPSTVADLEAEVAGQCGIALAEAGIYLRDVDGVGSPITPAVRQGLRKGVRCVGVSLGSPLVLTDAEVAALTPFATERVLAEALLFALEQGYLHWQRATQKHQEPLAPAPMSGGWLNDERRGIERRISELREMCSQPYREPADPMVVSNPTPGPWYPGCSPGDAGYTHPFGPYWWL